MADGMLVFHVFEEWEKSLELPTGIEAAIEAGDLEEVLE